MNRDSVSVWIAVDRIRDRHPRYRREARGLLARSHPISDFAPSPSPPSGAPGRATRRPDR